MTHFLNASLFTLVPYRFGSVILVNFLVIVDKFPFTWQSKQLIEYSCWHCQDSNGCSHDAEHLWQRYVQTGFQLTSQKSSQTNACKYSFLGKEIHLSNFAFRNLTITHQKWNWCRLWCQKVRSHVPEVQFWRRIDYWQQWTGEWQIKVPAHMRERAESSCNPNVWSDIDFRCVLIT